MKTIIEVYDGVEKVATKEIKQNFSTKNIIERKEELALKNASGTKREIFLEGVKIVVAEVSIKEPIHLDVQHDFPFFKIHFELEGHSSYQPKNDKSIPVLIDSGQYNFFYLPEVKGTLTYKRTRKVIEIIFTESYIKGLFKNNFFKVSANFGEAVKNEIPFIMFEQSKPISYAMQTILNDIINCSYQKEIKQVYLNSKIIEILSILISDLNTQEESSHINPLEYSKIEKAKNILVSNLQDTPTIAELSKLVGMNQQKLKVLFKNTYQVPVFKFVTNRRMELAQQMLAKNTMTISEISYKVGYKNPQHFTVAFKRKFNMLPSDFKNA